MKNKTLELLKIESKLNWKEVAEDILRGVKDMEHLQELHFTMSENFAPEQKLLRDIRTRRKNLRLLVKIIHKGKKLSTLMIDYTVHYTEIANRTFSNFKIYLRYYTYIHM